MAARRGPDGAAAADAQPGAAPAGRKTREALSAADRIADALDLAAHEAARVQARRWVGLSAGLHCLWSWLHAHSQECLLWLAWHPPSLLCCGEARNSRAPCDFSTCMPAASQGSHCMHISHLPCY